MRILWLKSDLLLPLDKGGKLRTWHLMRHLARRHDITYLAFTDPDTRPEHVDGMHEVARQVVTVPRRDPAKGSVGFYVDVARRLFDPLPYAVGKYRSAAYRAALQQLLATQSFDLIVCDFLPPLVNLPDRLPCQAVLFTHNVESDIWRRHADNAPSAVALLYRQQWRRMLRFEAAALRRFAGVLAVSDTDRDTFARLYPGAARVAIDVIATGVDTEFFTPAAVDPASRSIVFTGSMDWLPNEDAMRYFCHEVLPLVHAEEPDATLTIVGRTPTPQVQKLAGPFVTVTGRVDDVRPYLASAAVFVVPLRIGGGTRLKIFEAMAMGKAVVSTTIGAEGLPVTDGHDICLADDAPALASAIVRLLRDLPARQAMAQAARALVVERHDWAAVARDLETSLDRAARGHRPLPSTQADAFAVRAPVASTATSKGL